jgi:4-amino-4-deoxy-L-arabinose transferase-like glycosyltransferase
MKNFYERLLPFLRWLIQVSETIFLGILIFAGILAVIHQILSISFRYPLDYGEAPLVDQALRLVNGHTIYRNDLSVPPFTVSNYPPIYMIFLAPFEKVFGPNFWSGRLISSVCAWFTAGILGLIIWRKTQDRLAAITTGLIFMAFPYVVQWSSLARIDHLALLFSVSGIYYLTKESYHRRDFIIGVLLLTAAIYTRQSYALAAPATAFIWWLFKDWRKAIILVGLVGGISASLLLTVNLVTHGGFIFNIVTANVNEFGRERLLQNMDSLWKLCATMITVGVLSTVFHPKKTRLWLLTGAFLLSAAVSSLTIGKIGSNVNYFLELCAALSLGMGSLLAWSRSSHKTLFFQLLISVAMVYQTVGFINKTLDEKVSTLRDRRAAWGQLEQLEKIEGKVDGPVLADEYMGVITLNHQYLYLQPFEVTQLAWAGIWDQTPLLQGIHDKEYPLILIHYFPSYDVYKERWTKEMLETINKNYQIMEKLADTAVYKPRLTP